jgi:hypothetical protein
MAADDIDVSLLPPKVGAHHDPDYLGSQIVLHEHISMWYFVNISILTVHQKIKEDFDVNVCGKFIDEC